jgi:hypothetical protein
MVITRYTHGVCGGCLGTGPGLFIDERWTLCDECADAMRENDELGVTLKDPAFHRNMTGPYPMDGERRTFRSRT